MDIGCDPSRVSVKLLRSLGLLFGKDRADTRTLMGVYHAARMGGF
jgi:hypothetical protein